MTNEWLLLISGTILGIVVALQTWILLEIVKLKVSLSEHRMQIGRIVSDTESEKETRKRVHSNFETRLRALEFKASA